MTYSIRHVRALGVDVFAHLARVAAEDAVEHFARVDWSDVATYLRLYIGGPVGDAPWARMWVAEDAGEVVAHAALVRLPDAPGFCNGHISVERPHRGSGLSRALNEARFAWLDKHNLALAGPCHAGNDRSMAVCRAAGFVAEHVAADGSTWLVRYPKEHHGVD